MGENKNLLPKVLSIFDRIRSKFTRNQDGKKQKFLLDSRPTIKRYSQIEEWNIANIEERLQNIRRAREKGSNDGLTEYEANQLLEWTVQNAREGLAKDRKGGIKNKSLMGYCGFSQAITGYTLINMGFNPYITNASKCLGDNAGRHAFLCVNIPIKGMEEEKLFLIDATYRQFFLYDKYTNSHGEYINDPEFGKDVPSIPGYWLLKSKGGREVAEKILSDGYIECTEEVAKLYGDSFELAGRERESNRRGRVPSNKELDSGISGAQYIFNMTSPHCQTKIDYSIEEFDNWGINLNTPLMKDNETNKILPLRPASDIAKDKSLEHRDEERS